MTRVAWEEAVRRLLDDVYTSAATVEDAGRRARPDRGGPGAWTGAAATVGAV
ncbi:hypothetical protein [Streptomyces sp. enrichment culture]|uniref:hypothetical protein n=1 Tax=Streptomyces sp. enrichment culture TaxID=1795815 RepID=UPI003F54DC18